MKPLFDNVIIELEEVEQKTATGIIIPDSGKEKPSIGKVIKTGSNVVKVGERVYYKKWAGDEIKHENKDYIIVDVGDILAIL